MLRIIVHALISDYFTYLGINYRHGMCQVCFVEKKNYLEKFLSLELRDDCNEKEMLRRRKRFFCHSTNPDLINLFINKKSTNNLVR